MTSMAARASRTVRATGPWPRDRILRAAGALGMAAGIAVWTVTADPLMGGALAPLVLVALALTVAALGSGRPTQLPAAVGLLAVAAALGVLAADTAPATAALLGGAVVGVNELARWAAERRTSPRMSGGADRRRWSHILGVVVGGWALGAAAALLGPAWLPAVERSLVVGAVAIIVLVAALTFAGRARG